VSSTTLDATEEGAANFFAVDHSQHVEDRRAKRNAVQSVIFGVVSGNYGEKLGLGFTKHFFNGLIAATIYAVPFLQSPDTCQPSR
jgi:hypothetical protein